MNLSRRTLFYSGTLALLMMLFFMVYMVFLLPQLYVNHMAERNLEESAALHMAFVEQKSYENLNPLSPQGTFSFILPRGGDQIFFYSKFFDGQLQWKDEKLQEKYEKIRDWIEAAFSGEKQEFPLSVEELEKSLKPLLGNMPVTGQIQYRKERAKENYVMEQQTLRRLQSDTVLFSARTRDGEGDYSTIMILSHTPEHLILSFMPVINPTISQILPVTLKSLPMVMAVTGLLVLLASKIFSRRIIQPILKLADHAERLKHGGMLEIQPVLIEGKDEIAQLGQSLNELHETLKKQYADLDRKNKRQEVFLRASSHQLKTPLTGAMLLVEGMMGGVGKYKDVPSHLPELKNLLCSMQQRAHAVLEMERLIEESVPERIFLEPILSGLLQKMKPLIEEKQIEIQREPLAEVLCAPELMEKILAILLENALMHSPGKNIVRIFWWKRELVLINTAASISPALQEHLFDPFVGGERSKGHGLGLYLAEYYAQSMDLSIEIENDKEGVRASLIFPEKNILNTQNLHLSELG